MSWRIRYLFIIMALFFSCKHENKGRGGVALSSPYYSTKHLIEADALQAVIDDESVKIIDFRAPAAYKEGHIRGALNLWRTDIENKNYPYAGMMADKGTLERVFSKLGIANSDTVIIYDHRGLCDASRLWWVLKTYNFDNVKLLNGGWSAWNAIDGPVSRENHTVMTVETAFRFEGGLSHERYIDKDGLSKALSEGALTLIDTRSADEYSGKRLKAGAKKAGRIKGSINIDWMISVAMDSTQKFKSESVLEALYKPFFDSKDHPIVAYCHTGVRSAHTTFVLTELLGYTNVKNYDGSWTEWSAFDNLSVEKDSSTTIF